MKGKVPLEQVKKEFGQYLNKVYFMPIVDIDESDAENIVNDYLSGFQPVAFEFIFKTLKSPLLNKLDSIKGQGSHIWVNSLWESLNGGYEDDMAVINRDSIYGWYVDKGINIIQTDRPELLLEYLRAKKLHN